MPGSTDESMAVKFDEDSLGLSCFGRLRNLWGRYISDIVEREKKTSKVRVTKGPGGRDAVR